MEIGGFVGITVHPSAHLTIATRARTHRKKRIDKKWLKRYGFKQTPDPKLYFLDERMLVGHPVTVEKVLARLEQRGG